MGSQSVLPGGRVAPRAPGLGAGPGEATATRPRPAAQMKKHRAVSISPTGFRNSGMCIL